VKVAGLNGGRDRDPATSRKVNFLPLNVIARGSRAREAEVIELGSRVSDLLCHVHETSAEINRTKRMPREKQIPRARAEPISSKAHR
jgi:hypothetical protein